MIVRFTRRALSNLSDLHEWIRQDRPGTADLVRSSILNTITHLKQHPDIGRPGRVTGTRELVVPRLPYVIVYRTRANQIDILTILHTARRWPTQP